MILIGNLRARLRGVHCLCVSFFCILGASFAPSELHAQSFFATLVVDPTVGADRGSASQVRKLDETTTFLVFSNTGSDTAGRAVLGFGFGRPDTLREGDQLDITGVWAGPSDDGWRELLAGGIGYRFELGRPDTTGFVTVDYGDPILGTPEALVLAVKGDRLQIAAGAIRELDLGDTAKLRFGGELIARRVGTELLGLPGIDEELRMIRASVLYSKGIPFFAQQRLAFSVTKGFEGFGSSPSGNPAGSTPGADTDFLRAAFAAEASVPLSLDWVVNAGVIGQWTGDSLPSSQQCGFETNSYARAFDYAVVVGDRCLGSRVEIAYNVELPDLETMELDATQAFLGIDGGRVRNVGNALIPASTDSWSSLSIGVRTLRGDFLGEVAATRILDRPAAAADQDRDRFWFRLGYQF